MTGSSWTQRLRLVLLFTLQVIILGAFFWPLTFVFGRSAPIVPAGRSFTCSATRVWDGDGPLWCREGPRLRLAGIAAREIDGHCRPGQPCPRASGVAARNRLVQLLGGARGTTHDGHVLVRGPAMACRSLGPDRFGRTLASCSVAGRDLGRELVAAGIALPWHPRD